MKNNLLDPRVVSLTISIYLIQIISFYFNINGIPTSIMSAIVVIQSFIGTQYLKAYNRIIGTMLGVTFSFLVTWLFPENAIYIIAITLILVTFMTVITSLVSSERSYLCQLVVNTYAFVVIPVLADPSQSFHSLVFRATNVTLGVAILVIVSSLFFPGYSHFNLKENIRSVFKKTATFRKKIIGQRTIEADEIKRYFAEISDLIINKRIIKYEQGLSLNAGTALDIYASMTLILFFYTNTLRHSRNVDGAISVAIQNDVIAMINRAFHYRNDLRKFSHQNVADKHAIFEHHAFKQAGIRGLRAFFITVILLAVWYITGWQAGSTLVTLGIVYLILLSSFPAPVVAAKDSVYGTVVGVVAAWLYIQFVYGFSYAYNTPAIYFLAQLPILLYGGQLLFSGKTFLIGITFLTTFVFAAEPGNSGVVSYTTFINSSLGAIAGLMISSLGLVFIFPEKNNASNRQLIRRTLKELSQRMASRKIVLLPVINTMHDRLRLTGSSTPYTRDDFTVLANLSSLYVIFYHVRRHKLSDDIIMPLRRLLTLWANTAELCMDHQARQDFEKLMSSETGESKKVSMCAYDILREIERIYEQ